jgi:probable F420-dependent oxidoreductase
LLPAFGLGVASAPEHQAFGVQRADRAKIFDESLRLMRRLWTEDHVTHHGDWFQIEDVTVRPKPLQQPIDVWMGGIAPSELKRVGRLSDGWLPSFVTPADVADGIATVQKVAAEHDREIDPEHFGVLVPYANEPIDDRVLGFLAARRPDVEDPSQLVAPSLEALAGTLQRFIDIGASKFVAVPFAPLSDVTDELEALAEVVRPLEN